jgi:hypothetical protein
MEDVTSTPKQPYAKPILTKHKPLRDITASTVSPLD